MSGIIIVENIYDNWPKEINDCWISISIDQLNNRYVAQIIRNNDFKNQTIKNFMEFIPTNDVIGRIEWRSDNYNAIIYMVDLDNEYIGYGIGKWFFVLLRTYVAQNLGLKIVPPPEGTVPYINKILIEIAKEYNEETLEITTKNGKIKPFKDIDLQNDI